MMFAKLEGKTTSKLFKKPNFKNNIAAKLRIGSNMCMLACVASAKGREEGGRKKKKGEGDWGGGRKGSACRQTPSNALPPIIIACN